MANIIIQTFRKNYPEEFTEKSDTWVWEKLKNPTTLKTYFPQFKKLDDRTLLTEIKSKVDPAIKIEKYLPKIKKPEIEIDYPVLEEKLKRADIKLEPAYEPLTEEDIKLLTDFKPPPDVKIALPPPEKITEKYIKNSQKIREELRDKDIYEKLPTKKLKKKFWKMRKSKKSTLIDSLSGFYLGWANEFGFSKKFLDDPTLEVEGGTAFLGRIAAFSAQWYLLSPVAALVTTSRLFRFITKLKSAKMFNWISGGLKSGFTWSFKGITQTTIKQVTERKLDIPEIAWVGAKNFGFGFLLKGLPISKAWLKGHGVIIKHLTATGVSGAWGIIPPLVKKGYLDSEDVMEVFTMMAMVNLAQIGTGRFDPKLYKAYRNSGLQAGIKKRILTILRKGKKLPLSAQKDLGRMVENGGWSKDGKTKIENPVWFAIQNRLSQMKVNKLTAKGKGRLLSTYYKRANFYINKNVKEWGEKALNDVETDFKSYKTGKAIEGAYKKYIKTFWEELQETFDTRKSFAKAKDIINSIIKREKLKVDITQLNKVNRLIVDKIKKIAKTTKTPTSKQLEKVFIKKRGKISKLLSNVRKFLVKRIQDKYKKTLFAERKEDKLLMKEFIDRQNTIRKAMRTFMENINPKRKEEYIKIFNKKIDKTISKFREQFKLSKQGVKTIKKIREDSPLKFISEIERTDKEFTRLYKKAGEDLYKSLGNFNKLNKAFKKGILAREYLGDWFKGKGALEKARKIQDVKELKKMLPMFEEHDLREFSYVIKKLIDTDLPSKQIKRIGIIGKSFTPAWYTEARTGLQLVNDEMNFGLAFRRLQYEGKITLMRDLFKGLRKQCKSIGVNYIRSKDRIRLFLDGKLKIKLRPETTWARIKETKILNKFEFDAAKTIRKEQNEIFNLANRIMEMTGQKRILKITDYVTRIVKPQILNEFLMKGHIPTDIAKILKFIPKRIQYHRLAQHRKLEEIIDEWLVTDLERVMKTMYAIHFNWIAVSRTIKRIQPLRWIVKSKRYGNKFGETVMDFLENQIGVWKKRPAKVDIYFNNFLEVFARPLRALGFKVSPRPSKELADFISQVSHMAYIGGRWKFAVRNIGGQGLSVGAFHGPKAFEWALVNRNAKFAKKIYKDISAYITRYPMESQEREFMNQIVKILYAPVSKSDRFNVKLAMLASFYRRLRIHAPKGIKISMKAVKKEIMSDKIVTPYIKKAIEMAGREFKFTQWSYLRHELPPIMQSDFGRLAFMFNTWSCNAYFARLPELFRRMTGKDVWGNKLPFTDSIAAVRFFVWGLFAFGMKQIPKASFLWYLYSQQMFPSIPQLSPFFSGTYNLIQSAYYGSPFGDNKYLSKQYFYRAKQFYPKGVLPLYMMFDDFIKVINGKRPLAHLLLYQYDYDKTKKEHILKTPEEIRKEQQKRILKQMKDINKNWDVKKEQKEALIRKLRGLR